MGLVLLLNSSASNTNPSLESRFSSEHNPPYELYDYDIVAYFEPIDRQKVLNLIDDISCYSNPDLPYSQSSSRINICNRNFFFLAGSIQDSTKNTHVIYAVRYNLIDESTTIIFDELTQCDERAIHGYSTTFDIDSLIKDPTLPALSLRYDGNELGPVAELVYEDFIRELEEYHAKKQKERN